MPILFLWVDIKKMEGFDIVGIEEVSSVCAKTEKIVCDTPTQVDVTTESRGIQTRLDTKSRDVQTSNSTNVQSTQTCPNTKTDEAVKNNDKSTLLPDHDKFCKRCSYWCCFRYRHKSFTSWVNCPRMKTLFLVSKMSFSTQYHKKCNQEMNSTAPKPTRIRDPPSIWTYLF